MSKDLLNDLADAAERALQWIDTASCGNPGCARHDVRMLRQKIAEARES